MSDKQVSVSRLIDAAPGDIFDVLANPAGHAEIDGSGTVRAAGTDAPERLAMGAKFGMKMKFGVPYDIRNTVVEFQEDRLIAWAHFGGHRWRYELEETSEGTMVTETFDWSTAPLPVRLYIETAGLPEKHPAAMAKTLERLEALVT